MLLGGRAVANIANVVMIILLGGLLGGTAAYLVDGANRKEALSAMSETRPIRDQPLLRFLLLGLIAAACVPLFLSLVKSGLITSIFSVAAPGAALVIPYEDYLIFAGMCLIAAFSARTFIDSVSRQVLRKVESVEEKANVAARTASDAKKVATETANEVESIDANAKRPEAAEKLALDSPNFVPMTNFKLSDDQMRVLQAMTFKPYRTHTGIAADSGVSPNRISDLLEDLHGHQLAVPTTSPTTGGARWTISKAGQEFLTRD